MSHYKDASQRSLLKLFEAVMSHECENEYVLCLSKVIIVEAVWMSDGRLFQAVRPATDTLKMSCELGNTNAVKTRKKIYWGRQIKAAWYDREDNIQYASCLGVYTFNLNNSGNNWRRLSCHSCRNCVTRLTAVACR